METIRIHVDEIQPGMTLYSADLLQALNKAGLQKEEQSLRNKYEYGQLPDVLVVTDKKFYHDGTVSFHVSYNYNPMRFNSSKDYIRVIKHQFETIINMTPASAKHIVPGEKLYVQRIVDLMVHQYGMPESLIREDFQGVFPETVQVINVAKSTYDADTVDIELAGVTETYSFYADDRMYIQDDTQQEYTESDLIEVLERIAASLESLDGKMQK